MTIFDAPYLNNFVDPVRLTKTPKKSFPIRQDLSAIVYEIEYVQQDEFFRPAPLNLLCPDNNKAFLVDETRPKKMQNGLVQFFRKFATIPATRKEYGTGNFTFPSFKNLSTDGSTTRTSFTRSVIVSIELSYIQTTDPLNDISLQTEFEVTDGNGNIVKFVAGDTTPSLQEYQVKVQNQEEIQTQQTSISRWMGDIWEIENRKVVAL